MTFNLIQEAWIPARRKSGRVEWIPPWRITDNGPEGGDPFVELAASRPDFNGALVQFLIGLVQTLCPPEDERQWRKSLKTPPTPETLKEAFEKEQSAFNLDGPGPRFMQDLDELKDIKPIPVAALLIDQPGDNTMKENKDLFIKRGQVPGICHMCAAMALFTLQTNAPSGGQGHRTSLRGGGPLTTVILGSSLWMTVWLNVLSKPVFEALPGNLALSAPEVIFPWLGPTRTSEKGQVTTPEDVRPEHHFWGMPRRIKLVYKEMPKSESCSLCGRYNDCLVTEYRSKSRGFNYSDHWQHSLTPHNWKNNEPLPVHGQTGVLSYRHWLGFVQSASDGSRTPAKVCRVLFQGRQAVIRDILPTNDKPRIWAFGYDMDKMKARTWTEGTIPLILVDDGARPAFENHTAALIEGAVISLLYTITALLQALFKDPKELRWLGKKEDNWTEKSDKKVFFRNMQESFWLNTEPAFYSHLNQLKEIVEKDSDSTSAAMVNLKESWRHKLKEEANRLFEQYSQADQIECVEPGRVAKAWNQLQRNLNSKKFKKILTP